MDEAKHNWEIFTGIRRFRTVPNRNATHSNNITQSKIRIENEKGEKEKMLRTKTVMA